MLIFSQPKIPEFLLFLRNIIQYKRILLGIKYYQNLQYGNSVIQNMNLQQSKNKYPPAIEVSFNQYLVWTPLFLNTGYHLDDIHLSRFSVTGIFSSLQYSTVYSHSITWDLWFRRK